MTYAHADPFTSHSFAIEMDKTQVARFTECSGLQAEIEVFPYEEGGLNDSVHKLPGRAKFSDITLKRGMALEDSLWNWFLPALQGQVVRKDISIVQYSSTHEEERRWNLSRAYPIKWVGPDFKADGNAISIETLELTHEGLNRAKK